jgi:hypothetical protein
VGQVLNKVYFPPCHILSALLDNVADHQSSYYESEDDKHEKQPWKIDHEIPLMDGRIQKNDQGKERTTTFYNQQITA